MHNPDILLLDEPEVKVDIVLKDNINSFLLQINCEFKASILITFHDMYKLNNIQFLKYAILIK
ncbi:hypothetical protein DYQ05_12155 [Treponema pedis]|uniref:hypothetical protein n=1 Tax=Treponema pedis TaxID=409322 RepID=UPI00041D369B|nr:hypothetical protein [Treponema pedis]QSI05605.1 hypothetical protein DYQ05_12155 [Treponema pedis]